MQLSPDAVNALFESGGALAVANNCLRVWKDKSVKGVSLASTLFFTGWGGWNLYYYHHLEQSLSNMAGGVLVLINAIWLTLMWKDRTTTPLDSKDQK